MSQRAQMNQYVFPAGCSRSEFELQPSGTLTFPAESQASGNGNWNPGGQAEGLKGMGEAAGGPGSQQKKEVESCFGIVPFR